MSNWFYISKWSYNRWNKLNVELCRQDAEELFKAMLSYDSKRYYFALLRKKDKWKVVSDQTNIEDWSIISEN